MAIKGIVVGNVLIDFGQRCCFQWGRINRFRNERGVTIRWFHMFSFVPTVIFAAVPKKFRNALVIVWVCSRRRVICGEREGRGG